MPEPSRPPWLVLALAFITALGAASGSIFTYLDSRASKDGTKSELARSEVQSLQLWQETVRVMGKLGGRLEAFEDRLEALEQKARIEPTPAAKPALLPPEVLFKKANARPAPDDPQVQQRIEGYKW
jgi:hypothetical protein